MAFLIRWYAHLSQRVSEIKIALMVGWGRDGKGARTGFVSDGQPRLKRRRRYVAEHMPVLIRGHAGDEREAGSPGWAAGGGRGARVAAHGGEGVGGEFDGEGVVASWCLAHMLAGCALG